VAVSYAVIAWLVLQIGDVVLDPFDIGATAMRVLLVVVALGFPVALALAWFFELTPQGVEVDHGSPGAPRPAVTGVRRYADIVIIAVLVIAVAFLLARQAGLVEEETAGPVVAVLPFDNMSSEAKDAYFGEGLADTLIQRLGQLSELVVLASQSSFQYKGRNLELRHVGEELGATVIMLGSVQRAGSALRINARLLEVESGKQLWAGSYDRGIQDLFAIQDEIATAVTDALHLVLAPTAERRLIASATNNLTAYDAYVLGMSRLARRTGENFIQALDFFRQAIEADPDYALAYVGTVEAYYLMSGWPDQYGWAGTREEAVVAASKAVTLDPELGEAWLARALVAFADRSTRMGEQLPDEQIIALFERAIELSPSNASAYKHFATFCSNFLRLGEERVQQLYLQAARLDPRSGVIKINIGESFLSQDDFAQAEDWFRQAVDLVEPYFAPAYRALVHMHETRTGRLDEAARWAVFWVQAHPEDQRSHRAVVSALMDLGAWDRAVARQQQFSAQAAEFVKAGGVPWNLMRWSELNSGVKLARAMDNRAAVDLARQWVTEFGETDQNWPVVEGWGYDSWNITTLALNDVENGQASQALQRFVVGYPGEFEDMHGQGLDVLHPPVMTAALYKRTGDPERARELLEAYLAYVRGTPQDQWMSGKGWAPFTILAMLGESEAALDEFEAMVDAGYLHQWWALKDGSFDPDYAAVLATPRFEKLFARITTRVDELRAAYFAQPELPGGYVH